MLASMIKAVLGDILLPGTTAYTVKNLRAPVAADEAATKGYTDGLVSPIDLLLAALNGTPIAMGTWTPIVTGGTNISAIAALGDGIYLRAGNFVACGVPIEVTPTGSGSATYLISLPVPSDFGANADAIGIVRGQGVSGSDRVVASAPSDALSAIYSATAGSNHVQMVLAIYRVIS